jgi:type II secretory pathway component PulF
MRNLAAKLEQGAPLDEALQQFATRLPRHFLALVAAGLRTGTLNSVLQDFVEQQRRADDDWHAVRRALAYPIVILVLAAALFVFVTLWIVPQIVLVLLEFEVELPMSTRLMFWLSREGLAWIAAGIALALGTIFIFRWLNGPRVLHAVLGGIPILGTMWRLESWSGFSRLMALLLEHGVPLSEALRLTSEAVRDERLGRATRVLSQRCGEGGRMSEALVGLSAFPATLRPVIAWGETQSAMVAAFQAATDMFSARLVLQAQLVRIVAPPLTFLLVAAVVLYTIGALFGPFITVITNLSK